jgi:tetratricopeptide (TPR) repeat protein
MISDLEKQLESGAKEIAKIQEDYKIGDFAPQIEKNGKKSVDAAKKVQEDITAIQLRAMDDGLNKQLMQLEEEKRQMRGDSTVNKYLDFGGLGEAQTQWISLLHEGTLGQHNPNDVPDSWMMDKDFVEKMEEAVAGKDIGNWYTWMQLGVSYVALKKNEKAEECLLRSVHLLDNVWAEYALTCLYWRLLRKEDAVRCAKKALSLKPDDVSVAIDMLNMLCANEEYEAVLQAVAAMPEAVALNGRVLQYRARACVELGQLELAEELMENNVEAISTNVREGELSVTDLWITLQKKKAIARGEEPLEKYKVPQKWNFRMKNE